MNKMEESVTSNKTINSATVDNSPVDVHKLKKSVADRVRFQMDSKMTTVEIKVLDAIFTAVERLVIPKGELVKH